MCYTNLDLNMYRIRKFVSLTTELTPILYYYLYYKFYKNFILFTNQRNTWIWRSEVFTTSQESWDVLSQDFSKLESISNYLLYKYNFICRNKSGLYSLRLENNFILILPLSVKFMSWLRRGFLFKQVLETRL